jgi:hypothetical protein
MEYTFEQLQQFLMDTTEDCTFEIESDFTEEEIKDFDKVKALEYLIEFLDFERQLWQKKYVQNHQKVGW